MIFYMQENFKKEFKKRKRFFYLCREVGLGAQMEQDDEEIFMTPLGPNGRVLSNGLRVHVIGPRKDKPEGGTFATTAVVSTVDGLINSAHQDEVLLDETSSPTIILD